MGRVVVWVALLAGVGGCKKPATSKAAPEEGCLTLPAAMRDSLVASPDGQSLYWQEHAQSYDFEGELEGSWNLVRYDLRERRATVILEDVTLPIKFLGGQLVVPHMRDGSARLSLIASDGHIQDLAPTGLNVIDIEPVDSHTIAFLADGIGARAVYTLDLAELRPYALLDADTLLSTTGGSVLSRVEDDIVIVDLKTKQTSRVPFPKKATLLGDKAFMVDGTQVIEQDARTGSPKPVITKAGNWKLIYQGDSVLARTAPEDEKSFAYVLTGENAKQLPTVLGGASIIRTTDIGTRTWALVAHNTQNYIGDLADTNSEADVCLLPKTSEVTYPTRQVPARFAERSQPLFDAVKTVAPDATLQIMEASESPTTLHIMLMKERGASNIEAMRKRAHQIHDDVTRLLSDREVRTAVVFADRRVGFERWKRDRQRDRITIGMGDVLLTSAEDYDFEVSSLENTERDGKITCKGTLHNVGKAIEKGVDIQCSGNRAHVIHVDKLAADESRTFDQTFEQSDDQEAAFLEIVVDGKPSEPRFMDSEARNAKLLDVATAAFDDTGLWLEEHSASKRGIAITLHAEPEFLKTDAAAQEAAVKKAYDAYAAYRALYKLDAATPLSVHVEIERTDTTIDYDGSRYEVN